MAIRVEIGADPDILAFRQDLEVQKRSRYTIKHYSLQVRLFHEWLAQARGSQVALRQAAPADLKQYQIFLTTQRNHRKATLYHAVKALQSFYRFLGSTAADELKPPRRSQGLPKYLTESEATRLRESASDLFSRAVITLLLYSGLRVGELCRLTLEGIDFDERTVRVASGKGDKDRLIVVSARSLEDLRAWLKVRPTSASDFVFPGKGGKTCITERTIQRVVSTAARRAGIAKAVTPHMLRHTLATTLLRRRADIRFIQRMLGHASIATTQVYTHLDDADMKRMYDQSSPEY